MMTGYCGTDTIIPNKVVNTVQYSSHFQTVKSK